MSLDLGDLVGRIVLDDQYSGVLDRADGRTSSFGSTVGKVALGVGAAMAAIGVAAAVGVGALVSTGVKYNSEMETYQANLATLLGSTDAAKAQLGQLSAFAAATPFEMPQLADASQTLLSFGTSAADLMPDLKMLGDISLGNSDKLAGLATVFGQVQSTGHLMGQDLIQMINQGFNPLNEISTRTGESMSALKDRMAAGGISFAEVQQAMVDATSAGGQFYNAMQNGAMTFDGQVSTLTDGVHILAGSLTGDLTTALSGGALPAVNALVSGLVGLVTGVQGSDAAIQDAAGQLVSAISGGVGPAIESLAGNLGTVITAIAPVLGQVATTLVASLASIIPAVLAVASSLITSLVSAIIASGPQLIASAVPLVLSLVTGLLGQLPMLLQAGLQMLDAVQQGLIAAVPQLIAAASGALLGLVQVLIDMLPTFLDNSIKFFLAIIDALLTALPQIIAALPALIVAIVNYVVGAIPMLIDAGIQLLVALVGALPVIIEAIVKAIPQIIVGIITAVVAAIPKLISAGIQLLIALVQDMPTIISAIIQAVPQIIVGLVNAFSNPSTQAQMAKAGVEVMNGLWTGLQQIWGKISKWFSSVTSGLIDTFKSVLGIHSPSRVFYELGGFIGQGLMEGLADIQPDVDASINSMVAVPPVPNSSALASAMAGAAAVTNNSKTNIVNLENNRSTLDREALIDALGDPRIDD